MIRVPARLLRQSQRSRPPSVTFLSNHVQSFLEPLNLSERFIPLVPKPDHGFL